MAGNAFSAPADANGAIGNGPVGLLFLIMSVVGFAAWVWLRAKTRKATVTDNAVSEAPVLVPLPIRLLARLPVIGEPIRAAHVRAGTINRERSRRSAWTHVPLAVFGLLYVTFMLNFGYTRSFGLTPQAGDRFDQVMLMSACVATAGTVLVRRAATRFPPAAGIPRRIIRWQAVLWVIAAALALQVGAGMSTSFREAAGTEPGWAAPISSILVMRPATVEATDSSPYTDHDLLVLADASSPGRSFVYDRTDDELREIETRDLVG